MSLATLPGELKLHLANYLDVVDYFQLLRSCSNWFHFVENHAELLPTTSFASLRLEEFAYKRFSFKVTAEISPEGVKPRRRVRFLPPFHS